MFRAQGVKAQLTFIPPNPHPSTAPPRPSSPPQPQTCGREAPAPPRLPSPKPVAVRPQLPLAPAPPPQPQTCGREAPAAPRPGPSSPPQVTLSGRHSHPLGLWGANPNRCAGEALGRNPTRSSPQAQGTCTCPGFILAPREHALLLRRSLNDMPPTAGAFAPF
ncbi:WW domain-binding protein 11-like [Narcine bancroftii]|uniref:WW domain-binding protein 11-like n=1 Tax=Narcine bancroftii TaxID=1343680 RepID=UPI0038321A9E